MKIKAIITGSTGMVGEGYASIVPIKIDFTDMKMKEWLEKEWGF